MAKGRAVAKETSRREKRVSDDKVVKKGRSKKRAATPTDESDDGPTGGASVDIEPSDLDETKPSSSKTTKKEKLAEEAAEADDDTNEGGAMLFSIDTNPTPVDLGTVKTSADESSHRTTMPPTGPNRAARRRTKLIERQRLLIMQKMGIPEGSQEQADKVQKELDKWTETMDTRTQERLEKKKALKAKEQARMKNKRGKALTGRKLNEQRKQIRKAGKNAANKAAKTEST
ncbi:hypothetical protein F4802DRAFT_449251 [Xylaria palmicola]|nr:hypothetical protein F4802DRAFT_449251 [Xylaria palmicola]